ncbi:MAG: hypothetical protein AMJ79_10995 [Phycisphaerae bacterium SM23_30]|nr:MAG: hypothetical protein AMJ79_10995 [Phycisphaerae bacterium SM23_30]
MSKKWMQIYLIGVLSLGLRGCQEQGIIDQLREENPFQSYQSRPPSEIFIVSCQFQPMELPADVNLSELPFWSEPVKFTPVATTSPLPRIGFPPSQVQILQENGLDVKVAPMSYLPTLTQSIFEAGGSLVQNQIQYNLFRNAWEVADYPGYVLEAPAQLFVHALNGSVRSYELPPGYTVFQVHCQPWQNNLQNRIVSVRISPQFHLPQPPARYEWDESGQLQLIMDQPREVFDQLTFSGLLPPDYFICIAGGNQPQTTQTLGELFMRRTSGTDNYQLVYVLIPNIQTAAEIRNHP